MKYIKLQEISLPSTEAYLFAKYPGPGLYRNSDGNTYAAYFISAGATGCVMNVGNLCTYAEEISEKAPVVVGISEATLLKALAIAQQPALAKELTIGA
jgi:hypothetical protein